jgi:hypothetical protein
VGITFCRNETATSIFVGGYSVEGWYFAQMQTQSGSWILKYGAIFRTKYGYICLIGSEEMKQLADRRRQEQAGERRQTN